MKALTDSEEIVMKSVWELEGNCTLAEIVHQAEVRHHKTWQLQTVATFLKHLEKKGYVRHYKGKRHYEYEILVDETEYKNTQIRNFINFWNKGSVESFACDLFKNNLSEEEIGIVKDLIEEMDE